MSGASKLEPGQAAVEAAVFQGPFPGRLQADVLEHLTVAEIDVRRRALAALFQEIPELTVEVPQVRLSGETDAVGRIADDHPVAEFLQATEIAPVHANPLAVGQATVVGPAHGHCFGRDVAAGDQPLRQRPDPTVFGFPHRTPQTRLVIRQAFEPELLAQAAGRYAAIVHQGFGQKGPGAAHGVVERLGAVPPCSSV